MNKTVIIPIGLRVLNKVAFVVFLSLIPVGGGAANSHSTAVEKSEVSSDQLTPLTLLTVDKQTLKARLQTFPEADEPKVVLGDFRIAIGKKKGDKQVEGDNKTPEGIYLTRKSIDGKTLPKKYGPLAIPINFPNDIDILEGKTGHGIWLHGVEKASRIDEANVTEGCVAFYNEDIAALSDWLQPNRAVVVIAKDESKVNVDADRQAVLQATANWLQAWQKRSLKPYINAYHSDFKHRSGGLDAFRRYKQAVFRSYKKMTVKMSQIRVVTHPKYAISLMNQSFNGDNRYVSNGRKILYWQKEKDGQWRIVRERFSRRPFEQTPFTKEQYVQLTSSRRPDGEPAEEKKVH